MLGANEASRGQPEGAVRLRKTLNVNLQTIGAMGMDADPKPWIEWVIPLRRIASQAVGAPREVALHGGWRRAPPIQSRLRQVDVPGALAGEPSKHLRGCPCDLLLARAAVR